VLENLKLAPQYEGLLYLAEAVRNRPMIRSHRHRELEFNLVVQGSISYVVADRRFTFTPGALLWLFPAQEHQLVDHSADAKFFVAVFKPGLIARACRSAPYRALGSQASATDGVLHTWLEPESFDLARKIMQTLMEGAPDSDLLNRESGYGPGSNFRYQHNDPEGLNAGLQHLLLFAWRCQSKGQASGSEVSLHPAVARALRVLSEPDGDHSLNRLAVQCGVSAPHLSRLFARQIGTSLSRYRNTARLERFFGEYRGPVQKTIAEAAYAAGFGSYAHFHRVFVGFYGHGPRQGLAKRTAA